MSTWNMPPGVSTNDIPGQEEWTEGERRQRAIQALLDKWAAREFGQHAGYLSAADIVDVVLGAADGV
jgi:hypothetical protein